jgi:hypothetical protein
LTYAGYRKKTNSILWLCQCDCGERAVVRSSTLWHGKQTGCGCRQGKPKHGCCGTRTYRSYIALRQRCLNPKATAYPNYGGRGITVCDRWCGPKGFQNFLADMGERPRGKTIDRINVNGNYEPGNCRWATNEVQALNRRPRKSQATPEAEAAEIMGVDVIS